MLVVSGGADYSTYWVSILVGRIVECGIHIVREGGDFLTPVRLALF